MKKDTIVQFVCFATNLNLDAFAPNWERYAKRLMNNKVEPVLQQAAAAKNKFRYISQHEWPDRDFRFTFMNERKSEHFPEQNVKVVQIGGYISLQGSRRKPEQDSDVKLIAFISHDENDIDFYRQLPLYHVLHIHQAYYESCSYGYVLEFFVPENKADEVLLELKQRSGVEAALYKECFVEQL